MGMEFTNKIAVIVGGGWREPDGSIGGAICRELAARGAHVFVVDLDERSAQETAARISDEGGRATVIVDDASTESGCEDVVQRVIDHTERLDVLVNNIGISSGGGVVEASEADWDSVLAANVKSAALMCRSAIPRMKGGGAIVNTSSIAAERPSIHATYTTSKAAIEGLTRAVAFQYGAQGVRANCVRVGQVSTWRVLQGLSKEEAQVVREKRQARSVLDLLGDSWDVARAVAFLAGPDARWITGQVLTVDGGGGLRRGE